MTDATTNTEMHQPHDADHGEKRLTVRVFAPREPEPRPFHFEADQTVGSAAAEAAEKFGYAAGNHTFQNQAHEVLNRDLTLAQAGVHNGDLLELVEAGGGV